MSMLGVVPTRSMASELKNGRGDVMSGRELLGCIRRMDSEKSRK